MQIFLIIPFIFYINIRASEDYEPTKCVLPPTKYGPAYIQANNIELKKWRTSLNEVQSNEQYRTLLDSNKNIQCLKVVPKKLSEYRRCFQYAIETITELNGFIDFPGKNRLCINLEKYFEQSPYPKNNDLIIYTTDEKNHEIHHFAIAIDQIWFQSKSGSYRPISQHLPFDLMECYGNAVWSFELKQKYQGDKGKTLLLQDMQLDLHREMNNMIKYMNVQDQKIDELLNQNKKNKIKFFCFGAIVGITYMLAVHALTQQHKHSLS